MKVYVVLEHTTFGDKLTGIFKNEKDAVQYIDESTSQYFMDQFSLVEHEVIE